MNLEVWSPIKPISKRNIGSIGFPTRWRCARTGSSSHRPVALEAFVDQQSQTEQRVGDLHKQWVHMMPFSTTGHLTHTLVGTYLGNDYATRYKNVAQQPWRYMHSTLSKIMCSQATDPICTGQFCARAMPIRSRTDASTSTVRPCAPGSSSGWSPRSPTPRPPSPSRRRPCPRRHPAWHRRSCGTGSRTWRR